jgi:hypothetical protein
LQPAIIQKINVIVDGEKAASSICGLASSAHQVTTKKKPMPAITSMPAPTGIVRLNKSRQAPMKARMAQPRKRGMGYPPGQPRPLSTEAQAPGRGKLHASGAQRVCLLYARFQRTVHLTTSSVRISASRLR